MRSAAIYLLFLIVRGAIAVGVAALVLAAWLHDIWFSVALFEVEFPIYLFFAMPCAIFMSTHGGLTLWRCLALGAVWGSLVPAFEVVPGGAQNEYWVAGENYTGVEFLAMGLSAGVLAGLIFWMAGRPLAKWEKWVTARQ